MSRLLYLTLIMICSGCASGFTLEPQYSEIQLSPTVSPTILPTTLCVTPLIIVSSTPPVHPIMEIHTGYPSGLLNFRAGPGEEFTIIRTLVEGDRVEFLERQGNWYMVRYEGIVGYLYAEFVKEVK